MLVNKYIWVLFLCSSLVITSCIESTTIIQNHLRVLRTIKSFPDSSFFSDVRHLKYEDDYIYICLMLNEET